MPNKHIFSIGDSVEIINENQSELYTIVCFTTDKQKAVLTWFGDYFGTYRISELKMTKPNVSSQGTNSGTHIILSEGDLESLAMEESKVETKWEKLNEFLEDKIPSPILRLGEKIQSIHKDFTSSYSNWRSGYGWFPNSQLWNLDNTLSKYIKPRLEAFINYAEKNGHSYPSGFTGIEDWVKTLKLMLPMFMDDEQWYEWRYGVKKPETDYSRMRMELTEGGIKFNDGISKLERKQEQDMWKEEASDKEIATKLFAKHYYNLWD